MNIVSDENKNETEFDLNKIKFNDNGLVPVVVQDVYSSVVLMQAFMNKEALALTIKTGKANYFSRSRNKLWLKGETSGHFQEVVSISADCDYDSILLKVVQTGVACHTGNYSCFFNTVKKFSDEADISIIQNIINTIKDRATSPKDGSYTNYLLQKGKEKICKKVGEEATEVVIAAMKGDVDELYSECADFIYHMLVLLQDVNADFNGILKVLSSRYNK